MTWAENDGYMLFHAMTISLHVPEWPRANSHGNPERKLPSTKGFVEEYDLRRQWTRQLGSQWNNICEHLQWPILGKSNSVITKVSIFSMVQNWYSSCKQLPLEEPPKRVPDPLTGPGGSGDLLVTGPVTRGIGCESNLWYPGDMMHFPIINGQKSRKKKPTSYRSCSVQLIQVNGCWRIQTSTLWPFVQKVWVFHSIGCTKKPA